MEPNSQTIVDRLSQEREALGHNVSELESRAKAAISWREHFNKSPGLMLGLAFGGGLLLSGFWAAGSGSAERPRACGGNGDDRNPGFNRIVTALLAAGAGRAVKYLGDRVPALRDELDSHLGARSAER